MRVILFYHLLLEGSWAWMSGWNFWSFSLFLTFRVELKIIGTRERTGATLIWRKGNAGGCGRIEARQQRNCSCHNLLSMFMLFIHCFRTCLWLMPVSVQFYCCESYLDRCQSLILLENANAVILYSWASLHFLLMASGNPCHYTQIKRRCWTHCNIFFP